MKRFLLMLAIMLGMSTATKAQTHYASNVAIGVRAGADVSRVFFNPSVKQKLPFGAVAGFQFRYIEESHFGLIAELNFMQKGWENSFKDKDGKETGYTYRRTLDYIEIPVLAHIYFGRRGRFFVNVGPQVGFKIGEKTDCNFDPHTITTLPNFPYPNKVYDNLWIPIKYKVDFGITAGLGGEFSINPRHALNLEARFYYGIGNLFSAKPRDPFRASNTMAVSLTLGYWFRIK